MMRFRVSFQRFGLDRRIHFVCALLLIQTLSPSPALSTDYFVRVDGDDLLDGPSHQDAWQSLAHAEDNAEPNSVIHVMPGVYREDSHGAGFLNVNSNRENRTFLAEGDVTLRALNGGARVLHFDTAANHSFVGFTFDGEGTVSDGITSYYGNKQLIDCRFSGCLARGIYLRDASSVNVEGCSFGTESDPLPAFDIRLDDSPGCTIVASSFFTGAGNAVRVNWSDDLVISGNTFGSIEQPLNPASSNAIFIYESEETLIEANEMFLLTSHGIVSKGNDGAEIYTQHDTRLMDQRDIGQGRSR